MDKKVLKLVDIKQRAYRKWLTTQNTECNRLKVTNFGDICKIHPITMRTWETYYQNLLIEKRFEFQEIDYIRLN